MSLRTVGSSSHLTTRQLATLRALASAIIPRGGAFRLGADDVDTAGRLADYLSRFPAYARRALLLLITAWEYLPVFSRYRRPFSWLVPSEREAFLRMRRAAANRDAWPPWLDLA
jgi:hypothetical protein